MDETRFCIRLRSKHTGEEIVLGVAYATRDEAQQWADEHCCARCNSVSIGPVHPGTEWHNRHVGFVDPELRKTLSEQSQYGEP